MPKMRAREKMDEVEYERKRQEIIDQGKLMARIYADDPEKLAVINMLIKSREENKRLSLAGEKAIMEFVDDLSIKISGAAAHVRDHHLDMEAGGILNNNVLDATSGAVHGPAMMNKERFLSHAEWCSDHTDDIYPALIAVYMEGLLAGYMAGHPQHDCLAADAHAEVELS